jgi:hypothetical protein
VPIMPAIVTVLLVVLMIPATLLTVAVCTSSSRTQNQSDGPKLSDLDDPGHISEVDE